MLLVGQRKLDDFVRRHADAKRSLSTWRKLVRDATWRHILDARQQDPSADAVGCFTFFDVRSYRLATIIDYREQVVEVYGVYTHDEYMRLDWEERSTQWQRQRQP